MGTAWTDPTVTAGVTVVKKQHINELITALQNQQARRGVAVTSFTIGNQILASHINDLRTAAYAIKAFSISESVNVGTIIRKVHIDEIRAVINSLEDAPTYRSDGVSDCSSACTGLCAASCTGASICHSNCHSNCHGACHHWASY